MESHPLGCGPCVRGFVIIYINPITIFFGLWPPEADRVIKVIHIPIIGNAADGERV